MWRGRAILYPTTTAGRQEAIDAAISSPDRFALVTRLDARETNVAGWLEAEQALPNHLGIRLFVAGPWWSSRGLPKTGWPTFTTLLPNRLGPSFRTPAFPVVAYSPGAVERLVTVTERFPRLPLVIDELGLDPNCRDNAVSPRIEALTRMARFPQVVTKASHLPYFSTDPWPYRGLHKSRRTVLSAFGAERVHWAANFSEVNGVTEEDKQLFLGDATLSFFAWEV